MPQPPAGHRIRWSVQRPRHSLVLGHSHALNVASAAVAVENVVHGAMGHICMLTDSAECGRKMERIAIGFGKEKSCRVQIHARVKDIYFELMAGRRLSVVEENRQLS